MSREWKPGDVVTATVNGRPNVRVIAGWSKYDPQLRWGELSTRFADGDDDECWFMASQVTDHRPLVVIDTDFPRTLVKHLRMAAENDSALTTLSWLADQIESQTTPPRPDEPQGLGAVVEDANEEWVHFGNGCWIKSVPNANLRQKAWREFSAAVRVLSEGVQP